MEVILDEAKCVGAGVCVLSAPEVFDQNDDGIAVLLAPHPPADQHDAAREAAMVCAAAAITLKEER